MLLSNRACRSFSLVVYTGKAIVEVVGQTTEKRSTKSVPCVGTKEKKKKKKRGETETPCKDIHKTKHRESGEKAGV